MSRTTPTSAPPAWRPTLVEYLFLLAGVGISLYLIELGPIAVEPSDSLTNPVCRAIVPFLPRLLRLPEGIILLFPLFLVFQLILKRQEGLTAGEWLWFFSWSGTLCITGLVAGDRYQLLPEFAHRDLLLIRFIWYIGFGLAMASVAFFLALFDFFRPARPWTHTFALALALWPVLPLAGLLSFSKLFL